MSVKVQLLKCGVQTT